MIYTWYLETNKLYEFVQESNYGFYKPHDNTIRLPSMSFKKGQIILVLGVKEQANGLIDTTFLMENVICKTFFSPGQDRKYFTEIVIDDDS